MRTEVIIAPEVRRGVIGDLKQIIEKDLTDLRETIFEEFEAPKTGRQYRRPGGGTYRASAPGEPPAIRTRYLRDSVTEPRVQEVSPGVVGQIEITAPYAEGLEEGTKRVAPRPFVIPAIDALLKGLGRIGVR